MDTVETASRKVKQMGRQIESSMGNLKNMMSSISLVGDAKHFQEGKGKFDALREKLENKSEKQKLDAMKTLIAMMTLGRDVSELFPAVVKNVVVESMEIKKLVYMYVIHYAATNPNLALLSISSFQKDMASPNPLVRAKALHAMSCMRVTSVTHLIILALKNAVKDSSPYVRRTASQVLPSVCKLDSKWKVDLIAMLTTLLSDDNVYVLSGALFAFNMLCPNKFDLLHINYRKICHLLADMDEYGQAVALQILIRYCRNQFKSPFMKDKNDNMDAINASDEEKKDDEKDNESDSDILGLNNSDDDDFVELDSDHKLLIDSCKNLVHSMNSSVVLSVVTLLFYCAPKNDCIDAIRALIQFVNFSKREIAYCVLANISTMASTRSELFAGFYKDFYIKSIEAGFIKELKLDILSKIATETNIGHILREFEAYAKDSDIKFRCSTIEAMGRCSSMIPDVAEKTMHSLMSLLSPSSQSPDVVAASVIVIRQIIQRNPSNYEKSMLKLLKLLHKTNVPQARCAIVWIIGEYRQYISDYVPDALRILAKKFIHEANEVKMQILNLAVKVYLAQPKKVILLFKYILDLCKYDQNYDLRDRARLVRCVFFQKKKKKSSAQTSEIDPEIQRQLRTKMQEMFLSEKKLPEIVSPFQDRDRFVMNTLSHMVLHSAGDNYKALQDFPDIPPNNSEKRTPVDNTHSDAVWKSSPKHDKKSERRSGGGGGFFDDSVEEYTSSDSNDSDTDSDDSDSDSDSGSDSDDSSDSDTDESDSDNDSDSESDSDDESESESDSDEDSETESESVKKVVKVGKAGKSKSKKKEVCREESEVEEEEEESSSDELEVAELYVSASGHGKNIKEKEKEKEKDNEKIIKKKGVSSDENNSDSESESESEQLIDIGNKKEKIKIEKEKSKAKESKPETGDLLGDLFGDISAKVKPTQVQTESINPMSDNENNNNNTTDANATFEMFDLLGSGSGGGNKNIKPTDDDDDTKDKELNDTKATKKSSKKSKKEKKSKSKSKKNKSSKSKKKKKEISSDEQPTDSDNESDLGSDDFASDSDDQIQHNDEMQLEMKQEEEKKLDPLMDTSKHKNKKKERADQLSDLFSSVMGDNINSNKSINVSDDILFGASAETLMKSEKDFVGFKGELLNHTHTQGLQIEYEFVRQTSRYGIRFNQIKLIFQNRWDHKMRGISLCPHNLDKSQQDYRDIFDGGIAELSAGQKKVDFIHVQFGKTSEMRFDIDVEEGTNKKRHTAKIKGIPGELMRPNVSYSVDDFIKKKGQTGAMNERNLNCATDSIEEAANNILKSFNVGIVNSGANKNKFDVNKQRYFAGYLLADDSDVLIALESTNQNKIICTIHCTEFMLIDAITGVARQCLANK